MSVPAEPGAGASPQPTLTSNSLYAHPLPTPLTDAHLLPASLTDVHLLPAPLTDAHPLPLPPLTPHVKVTPWRLLNTVLVLALGIYKAAASYLGQSIAPTTLDWIIGVVWTLICYWVGFAEQENSTWFFSHDLADVLRVAFTRFFFVLVFTTLVISFFASAMLDLIYSRWFSDSMATIVTVLLSSAILADTAVRAVRRFASSPPQ
ncbi:hypothetical protein FB451DRAFT_1404833 [Mycena latifolia]|nr:hypothetical protein FB451DRAFT_1404833 [Mycena latifolia]